MGAMSTFKPLHAALLATLLMLNAAPSADAHVVYFKDGTAVRGLVTVKEGSLIVQGGGTEMSFPLDAVRSVSFSDEPIVYEQRPQPAQAPGLDRDALLWTVIGVNILAVATAAFALSRPGASAGSITAK
jgi:hypothetical protein